MQKSTYHQLSTIQSLLEGQEKYLGRKINWDLLRKYRMLCNRMFAITTNNSQDPYAEYIFTFNSFAPTDEMIKEIAEDLLGYTGEDDWNYSTLGRTLVIYGLEY